MNAGGSYLGIARKLPFRVSAMAGMLARLVKKNSAQCFTLNLLHRSKRDLATIVPYDWQELLLVSVSEPQSSYLTLLLSTC